MTLPVSSGAEAMLSRLEESTRVPLRAMLEISDRCNEVCVHCYQIQGQKGEMSTEQIGQVLDQLAELGVLLLTVSGGEPTLRKDFVQILEMAKARGFVVRLFTNGLTMTAELAREIARSSVMEVEISLYSTRPEMHDFVTGVPGSFERTTQAVRLLVAQGVVVMVKTPVMSLNQDETDDYVAFAASLGAQHRFDVEGLVPREGRDRSPELWNPGDEHVARLLHQHDPSLSSATAAGPRDPTQPICGAARTLHIEPNGELRPCTILEVDLGNATAAGVKEAFFGPGSAASIRDLQWKDVHGCRDCALAGLCGRCHATALAEVGDALAPYAGACRRTRMLYQTLHGKPARIVTRDGRDPEVGPYRELSAGVFETLDDLVTPEDDALAARLGWVRRSSGGLAAPEVAVRPGQLVQIRRPGRKVARLEHVPDTKSPAAPASAEQEPPSLSPRAAASG